MRVIWKGDMTKLADVVMLQMVLDNAHTWATRTFKPLMASYIEQWQYVFDESITGGTLGHSSAFFLSKKRREKTVEQRRAIVPMVQGLIDDQDTMELDDMANKRVTPLLLGLMMHQICSLEKELIASEVDRVVSQRLEGLSMRGVASGMQYSSQGAQSARSRAHSNRYSDRQESIFGSRQTSQYLPLDNDDPNDSDYRPSQDSPVSIQTTSFLDLIRPDSITPDTLPSTYEFSFHSSARAISKGSEAQPSRSNEDRLLDSPDGNGRESPFSSGGQVTPKPSSSTLVSGLLSSSDEDVSQGISKGTTPSGLPVITDPFSLERRGQQLGQPKLQHPHGPMEDSSEKSQFQDADQDESDYIDLTEDSQEGTS
ncbi:uncharacterized protein FSUBG_11003 [Fusarium subglutinans]|uniref:Uncharacterized protein n=1 Tax=Gibberella subglutinans TaxID=42677 RepID=A0A8H5P4G9_GIBSU|nr:uncharacterized protein FSUBG_11003 [Fusarium subglutinans]KAF5589897.1 hypothetical protein FSUBG_11003 [Fusarium subglutinans]